MDIIKEIIIIIITMKLLMIIIIIIINNFIVPLYSVYIILNIQQFTSLCGTYSRAFSDIQLVRTF